MKQLLFILLATALTTSIQLHGQGADLTGQPVLSLTGTVGGTQDANIFLNRSNDGRSSYVGFNRNDQTTFFPLNFNSWRAGLFGNSDNFRIQQFDSNVFPLPGSSTTFNVFEAVPDGNTTLRSQLDVSLLADDDVFLDAVDDVFLTANDRIDFRSGAFSIVRMMVDQNGRIGMGTSFPNANSLVTVRQTNGTQDEVATFINTSTDVQADGIEIRLGPTSNPGSGNSFLFFQDGDGTPVGTVSGNGTGGVNYVTTSDRRLKTKITPYTNALEKLMRIEVAEYEMISAPGIPQVGFIAQQLQEVYPYAVSGSPNQDMEENGPMGVDYGQVTPLLVKSLQEQQQVIEELRKRIAELESSK